jgi:SAM-dependent methyltransferase
MLRSWAYPIRPRSLTGWERLAKLLRRTVGYCDVCRRPTIFTRWTDNFRESGVCLRCGSFSRQRQIAHVIHRAFAEDDRFNSLAKNELAVLNTETRGSFHLQLTESGDTDYVASEYLGPDVQPGQIINGMRHEDVQRLSLSSASLDLVISSDVWEHVPDPYGAHAEVLRVLKPGGHHIFTVPFHQMDVLDDRRAELAAGGTVHHMKPPIYHSDPMSPEGTLVFTIFSLEMLSKLEQLGFRATFYCLYAPWLGILGHNGLVFDAEKPEEA